VDPKECKKIEAKAGFHHFFNDPQLRQICHLFKVKTLSKGQVLFKEGEPGQFIAFVISGKLEIKKQTEFPDKHFVLAMLGPGAFVGEMAIADKEDNIRSATATALEDTTIAFLERKDFEQLLIKYPESSVRLLRAMLRIVCQRLDGVNQRMAAIF